MKSHSLVFISLVSSLNAVEITMIRDTRPEDSVGGPQLNKNRKVSRSLKYLYGSVVLTSSKNRKNETKIGVISCEPLNDQTSTVVKGGKNQEVNPEDFIDQVAQGFYQINKTKVGQLLLEEIAELNSNDLVIFNINFPILLNLQVDSNGAFKNQWLQKVPIQIRQLLGWDDNFMLKNNISVDYIRDFLLGCYSSCFLAQVSSLFAKNLIFIGPEKFTNCLWDLSDATIRVTDEDIPIHLHLFHELNHYKHFKKTKVINQPLQDVHIDQHNAFACRFPTPLPCLAPSTN